MRRWTIDDLADALAWAGVALLAVVALAPRTVERLVTSWIP